ncbi:MAG: hypothetical protein KatS3mg085_225 [Candidatus Dojkabacteria bacterium]|nr:MAG: hypothetical protein KatS3mg085_225 [Candidatus Dojkabacteria bacterium]
MLDKERNNFPDHLVISARISYDSLKNAILSTITKFFLNFTILDIDLNISEEDSYVKFTPHRNILEDLIEELLKEKTPGGNYVVSKTSIRNALEKYIRLTSNQYIESLFMRQEWVISKLTDAIFIALYKLKNS